MVKWNINELKKKNREIETIQTNQLKCREILTFYMKKRARLNESAIQIWRK